MRALPRLTCCRKADTLYLSCLHDYVPKPLSYLSCQSSGHFFLTACPETPTYPFVCENGTPGEGSAITANIQLCASCNTPDFVLEGSSCVAFTQDSFPFVCENGTAETNVLATAQNVQLCTSCNTPDFVLQGSSNASLSPRIHFRLSVKTAPPR